MEMPLTFTNRWESKNTIIYRMKQHLQEDFLGHCEVNNLLCKNNISDICMQMHRKQPVDIHTLYCIK